MKQALKWVYRNPLISYITAFMASTLLLFALFKPSPATASDESIDVPLDQPMTTEMIVIDNTSDSREVIILEKETGEIKGYGWIQYVKDSYQTVKDVGVTISQKSHNLYEKWISDPENSSVNNLTNSTDVSVTTENPVLDDSKGKDIPTQTKE